MKRILTAGVALFLLAGCANPPTKADAIRLSEAKLSICLDRARVEFATGNFIKLDNPQAELNKLVKACQDRHEARIRAIDAYYA